ncbi:hypothetical protein BJY52DRAFT_1286828 [Lactarius psammicola]|nr:hypothetical protein BJY52DRAFT_1286828 [Lactarius psammicola]
MAWALFRLPIIRIHSHFGHRVSPPNPFRGATTSRTESRLLPPSRRGRNPNLLSFVKFRPAMRFPGFRRRFDLMLEPPPLILQFLVGYSAALACTAMSWEGIFRGFQFRIHCKTFLIYTSDNLYPLITHTLGCPLRERGTITLSLPLVNESFSRTT